jgi:Domain of unknown function DUF11
MVAAASVGPSTVELRTDQESRPPFKRHGDDGRDRRHKESEAVADPTVDLSATSREMTPTTPASTSALPAQSEPGPLSGDVAHGDATQTVVKHDDLATAGSPALPSPTDGAQSPVTENAQTREAAKPESAVDSIAANPGDTPQNANPAATPPKPRHRHHPSDTTAAASGDSAFPNLDGPPQGAGDSTPKTAAAAGPSLGLSADPSAPKDAALPPPQAVPVVAKDGATPGTQPPKSDVDIFGALQDQPAAKHDSKGPDFGAAPSAEKPIEGKPRRRHRKNAPPQDGPAPEPIRTADQSPSGDSLDAPKPNGPDPGKPTDSKPTDKIDSPMPLPEHAVKGPDAGFNPAADQAPVAEPPKRHRHRKTPPPDGPTPDSLHAGDSNPIAGPLTDSKPPEPEKTAPATATAPAPTAAAPVPATDLKKPDDWSAPSTNKADEIPKAGQAADKAAPAPEHDLLGTLNEEHPEKHEPVTNGPSPAISPTAISPTATSPTGDEPPKRRRRKKSAEAGSAVPAPVPVREPGPTNDHAPIPKPAEAPALIPSDATKGESKPAELSAKDSKPAELPALGDAPVAKEPAKPEPKLEAPIPPSVAPADRGALHPAVDESQQANVSFTRSPPEKIDSGNLLAYKIVVRNNGTKLLKLVEIDEAVPADHTVHATEPAAEVHDQTLHWSVRDLAPHEATTLAITLAAPPPPQPIVPAAAAPKPERQEEDQFKPTKADVAVSLPHVELELIAPSSLRTGESCRLGFRATNLGLKTSGLKLNLDLPPQLHFGKGQKLLYKVGDLDGHESREDYLTATATTPGIVEIQGSILLDGRTLVSAKATCRIDGAPAAKQAALPKRDRLVVPASASETQRHVAAPCCDP